MAKPATTLPEYQDQLQRVKRMFHALPGLRIMDYGDSANYYLHLHDLGDQRGFLLSYDWQAGDTHWNLQPIAPVEGDAVTIAAAVTDPADKVARTAWQAVQPVLPDLRDVFSRALSVIEESDSADEHAPLIEEMRLLLTKGRVR